jgi:hypothetical protein
MQSTWDLSHVPLAAVEPQRVRGREDLFYMVTSASFVENGAALYTANLASFFAGDDDFVDWLTRGWQVEELGHGRALRAYARHVWPEFPWDEAYAAFLDEYSRQCTVGALERSRPLELVARCVVETGTSTYYRALAGQAGEPILAGIATRISAQEIDHYKHFYAHFRRYGGSAGRADVLAALGRRLIEIRNADVECAMWHVFAFRTGGHGDRDEYRRLSRQLARQLKPHYPAGLAARMLLKPLGLPAWLGHALQVPLAKALALAIA